MESSVGSYVNIDILSRKGLDFDGVSDTVNLGDVYDLGLDSWTFEAWVRPDVVAGSGTSLRTILSKTLHGVLAHRYSLSLNINNQVSFQFYGNTGWDEIIGTSQLPVGKWSHIAMVFDRTLAQARLCVDGVIDLTHDITVYNSENFQTSQNFFIGSYDGTHHFFDGSIDELRIWRVVRTVSDISTHRTRKLSGIEEGLVGYFPMDEGVGGIIYDNCLDLNTSFSGPVRASGKTIST